MAQNEGARQLGVKDATQEQMGMETGYLVKMFAAAALKSKNHERYRLHSLASIHSLSDRNVPATSLRRFHLGEATLSVVLA